MGKFIARSFVACTIMAGPLLACQAAQAAIVNPTALSGLQLWLDGSDPDGDGVVEGAGESGISGATVTWADKSGNTRDFTQSTAARQPVYSSSGFAGAKGAYDFTGGSGADANGDILSRSGANSAPLATGDDDYTYVVVWNADLHNQFRYVYTQGAAANNQRGALILTNTQYGFNGLNNDANGFVASQVALPRLSVMQVNNNSALFGAPSGAAANIRVFDSGSTASTNLARTGNPANLDIQSSQTWVGGAEGTSSFFDGKIAEIIVYDRVLNQAEVQDIGAYLSAKYATRWNYVSPTVIVDDGDSGYSESGGGFGNAGAAASSLMDNQGRFTNGNGSSATWTPPTSVLADAFGATTGEAFVQVHWEYSTGVTQNASYTVTYDGGQTAVISGINQRLDADGSTPFNTAGGSGWYTLGKFLNPTSVTASKPGTEILTMDAIRIGKGEVIDDNTAVFGGAGWNYYAYDSGTNVTRESSTVHASNIANATATYDNLVDAAGMFNVDVSWSAYNAVVSPSTNNAQYLIDLDGNLGTTGDQTIFSGINQRLTAAGVDPGAARYWSGYYTLGVFDLTPSSIIVLSHAGTGYLSADNILITEMAQEAVPEPSTLALAALGLLSLTVIALRGKKSQLSAL